MALYLNIPKETVINNISDLIIWGFNNGNSYYTCFAETYKDKDHVLRELYSARRSFEDMLEICQTYFPETTPKILAKALYKLGNTGIPPSSIYYVRPFYCFTIKKLVFMRDTRKWDFGFDSRENINATLAKRNHNGNSPWCYNDIMYLIQVDL